VASGLDGSDEETFAGVLLDTAGSGPIGDRGREPQLAQFAAQGVEVSVNDPVPTASQGLCDGGSDEDAGRRLAHFTE
jgi:hypothetical protein